MRKKACLIIPCYNEADRLDFTEFNAADPDCCFLFVNDGSSDGTLKVLKDNIKGSMYILDIKNNIGKGEAVRQGLFYLKTLPVFNEIKWVGYWDADLAAPLYEVNNFLLYSKMFAPSAEAVFGSRIIRFGSNVKRNMKRHYLGRLFATVVSGIFHAPVYDSQCGAKLFKKELIDGYFDKPFISRWIFDVEIILRMRNVNIVEYPLKDWKEKAGSKIKIYSLIFKTVIEIINLIKTYHTKPCEKTAAPENSPELAEQLIR